MHTTVHKLLFILLGAAAGLLAIEGSLRLLRGDPRNLPHAGDPDFLRYYVWNHEPHFVKKGDQYVASRSANNPAGFAAGKSPDERRVFIIGESVAEGFAPAVLRECFSRVAPQVSWEVINAGYGGYDSYDIVTVAKEVLGYRPDLVVLMMGNNCGTRPHARINYWPYKYPWLSQLWVTRLVTDILNPPLPRLTPEKTRADFQTISALCRRAGVPLVLCTLPVNYRVQIGSGGHYQNREFFEAWWQLRQGSDRAVALFAPLAQRDPKRYAFFLARACERAGLLEDAKSNYDRAKRDYRGKKFNNFIRHLARENGHPLADVEMVFMRETQGMPGFELFYDDVHPFDAVYYLVADEIIASLRDAPGRRMSAQASWRFNDSRRMPLEEVMRRIKQVYPLQSPIVQMPEIDCEALRDIIAARLQGDHKMLDKVRAISLAALQRCRPAEQERLRRNYGRLLTVLGTLASENGERTKAAAFLDEAVAVAPEDYLVYFFRGLFHYDLREKERAAADFAAVRRLNKECLWLDVYYLDSLPRDGKDARPTARPPRSRGGDAAERRE